MIVAFSTSSPVASVALIREEGGRACVAWHDREEAQGRSSSACLALLERGLKETGEALDSVDRFVADVGPGSFTGVRVGVTLAKTLAFSVRGRVAGVSAFDLISADRCSAIPNRKNEWLIRQPGEAPVLWHRGDEPPFPSLLVQSPHGEVSFSVQVAGYGAALLDATYPDASRVLGVWTRLSWFEPERLVPDYLVGPSISRPKRPYAERPSRGGAGD